MSMRQRKFSIISLLLLCFLNGSVLANLSDDVEDALTQLSPVRTFIHFDIGFSSDEIAALQSLAITTVSDYECFGHLEQMEDDVFKYLNSLGSNDPISMRILARKITDITQQTVLGFHAETAWVVLRASKPHSLFDIPRWHTDGYFVEPYEGEQRKVVITLKGKDSGTRFYPLPKDLRDIFNALQDKGAREELAKLLTVCAPQTAHFGQGSIFISGIDYATVHSEPPIHEDRLFMSIFPTSFSKMPEIERHQMNPSLHTKFL